MQSQMNVTQDMLEDMSKLFFQELKKELNIASTKSVVRITRAVLTEVRKSFSLHESSVFLNTIPSLFQLLFINQWKHKEEQNEINHLDELIDAVYKQDAASLDPVFHSEIEVLNAVVLILRKLDRMFGLLDFSGFKFSLVQEVRQIPLEDAA